MNIYKTLWDSYFSEQVKWLAEYGNLDIDRVTVAKEMMERERMIKGIMGLTEAVRNLNEKTEQTELELFLSRLGTNHESN